MVTIFIQGFFLQASLILALGAQNIFVLESGLKKQRQFLVATLCSACDALLIAFGVMGAASVFLRIPMLKIFFGVVGVLFLLVYGVRKFLEGSRAGSVAGATHHPDLSKKQVVLSALGFSLLNPHVYLDTVVLIGGYSAKFLDFQSRAIFGLGAGSFSVVWFFGLTLFDSSMSAILYNQKAMRAVSLVSGAILIVLSFRLAFNVYEWLGMQAQ